MPNPTTQSDHRKRLWRLRLQVRSLAPAPTSQHSTKCGSVPTSLQLAKFVFIGRYTHRSRLQHPYEGPFKVIQLSSKTFLVDIGGKSETISVDRLKYVHVDLDQPVQVAIPKPCRRPPKLPSCTCPSTYQHSDSTHPDSISGPQPQYSHSGHRIKPPP